MMTLLLNLIQFRNSSHNMGSATNVKVDALESVSNGIPPPKLTTKSIVQT